MSRKSGNHISARVPNNYEEDNVTDNVMKYLIYIEVCTIELKVIFNRKSGD